mmetsp:Transcript_12647/g.42765  ORF Transcript_12647/g.42765 Transcript_12647/m.42765 type:complete len:213 (+) Transcript_12647:28-666(+)
MGCNGRMGGAGGKRRGAQGQHGSIGARPSAPAAAPPPRLPRFPEARWVVSRESGRAEKPLWCVCFCCGSVSLSGARELGHRLGALGHGVLGELAGEEEPHGRLDLARGERGLLVVARQAGRLHGEALEDVVDEGVHDGHAALGDARLGVHLLEHLVDVARVRLDALLRGLAPGLLGRLGGLLAGRLGHGGLVPGGRVGGEGHGTTGAWGWGW